MCSILHFVAIFNEMKRYYHKPGNHLKPVRIPNQGLVS